MSKKARTIKDLQRRKPKHLRSCPECGMLTIRKGLCQGCEDVQGIRKVLKKTVKDKNVVQKT